MGVEVVPCPDTKSDLKGTTATAPLAQDKGSRLNPDDNLDEILGVVLKDLNLVNDDTPSIDLYNLDYFETRMDQLHQGGYQICFLALRTINRGRRYYRNRSGIAILVSVFVSESNFIVNHSIIGDFFYPNFHLFEIV